MLKCGFHQAWDSDKEYAIILSIISVARKFLSLSWADAEQKAFPNKS